MKQNMTMRSKGSRFAVRAAIASALLAMSALGLMGVGCGPKGAQEATEAPKGAVGGELKADSSLPPPNMAMPSPHKKHAQ